MDAEVLFWLAVGLLGYTYMGYPVMVWALARRRPPPAPLPGPLPSVSILIVACNEAHCIGRKLDNLLALDYPRDRLQIIVASDGAADTTAAIARANHAACVRVVEFKVRRGKSAVLNDIVPAATGEVLVLADARQEFDPGALRALVAHFSDPGVGVVGGDLMFREDNQGESEVARGMGAYWRYETFIRRAESRLDSTVGASGAIYAIRRSLFESIPDDIILDDVLIPMQAVRRGYRALFEPRAIAYDQVSSTSSAEFVRKVRTLAGNFQLFLREPWLLAPWSNRIWLQTVSHKVCRLLSPAALVTAFASSLVLAGNPVYAALLALQGAFYLAGALGHLTRDRPRKVLFLNIPYTFLLLNWATLVGFWRFVSGRQRVIWQITQPRGVT